ncbi:MAG: M48 family metalloprotease [Gammaproteobacteria bacterium AqS3]|nr:M48 family metalloprotease [Gammaproteobacteria bacterium AqS3]
MEFLKRSAIALSLITLALGTQAQVEKPSDNPAADLPQLGNTGTLVTSLEEEYTLGKQIVRQFRGQAPLVSDPLVIDYMNSLAFYILRHSEVEDRRITLLVFDLPVINAFAAPGGIIGMYSGMIQFMENEGQIASILAHEFAHLSQRHYARNVEYNASRTWRNLLLGLGSVLVAVSSSGDTGIAALTAAASTIAADRLSFSRENEREADQIGSQTLINAKIDPDHVAQAFEQMQKANNDAPPEYLLTHPLPTSRVNEARLRARQSESFPARDDLGFQIIRARLQLASSGPQAKRDGLFANWRELSPNSNRYAAAYARALLLAELGEAEEARRLIRWVRKRVPDRISVLYAEAEVEVLLNKPERALALLKSALDRNPRNLPLLWLNARAHKIAEDATAALRTLELMAHIDPTQIHVWYQLAELHGLAGNIAQVHKSRAEFFYLTGRDQQALDHLEYALELARHNFTEAERIRERMQEISGEGGVRRRRGG